MSAVNLQNTELNSIYNNYKSRTSLIKNLMESPSRSGADEALMDGVTNLDTYATDELYKSNNKNQSNEVTPAAEYGLSNLNQALDTLNNSQSFDSLTNVSSYATDLLKNSQLSQYSNDKSATASINPLYATDTIEQDVSNAYKSSTAVSKVGNNLNISV